MAGFHGAIAGFTIFLVGVTPIQCLLVLEPVLFEVGEFLQVSAGLAVVVIIGGYSKTCARTKVLSTKIILCACHMLLLKLHSEIVIPIRAVGDSTAHCLFLKKLGALLLKLRWRIMSVRRG